MNVIKIHAYANRKLSERLIRVGNMRENQITKLKFELDEDIIALGGNVFLFVNVDGETFPFPLKDHSIQLGREITQNKRVKTNLVISQAPIEDRVSSIMDGVVWISDTLELWSDYNSIDVESLNATEVLIYQALNDFENSFLGGEW